MSSDEVPVTLNGKQIGVGVVNDDGTMDVRLFPDAFPPEVFSARDMSVYLTNEKAIEDELTNVDYVIKKKDSPC